MTPVLVLLARPAASYETYTAGRGQFGTNCGQCHGDFRAFPYFSQADGQQWPSDLHNVHRNTMLGGDCNVCHVAARRNPVFLDLSVGGTGFAPISCVGCHGRAEDRINPAVARGDGAGLRQHHWNAGETVCGDCHDDADPATYAPAPESARPPYYFVPDAAHPAKPTNPCNPNGEEQFAASALGLDNDGDAVYDAADSDCSVASPTATATQIPTATPTTDPCAGVVCPPTGNDCTVAVCDPADGVCKPRNLAEGSSCSDSDACTTDDRCTIGTCTGGAPLGCDDGNACTDDACGPAAGCTHTPNAAPCDDGRFCTVGDTCANGTCGAGAPRDCDDGFFCTGSETCNEGTASCDSAGNPCDPATETCNEATGSCETGVVDMDISKFRVTKRVRLRRVSPIAIVLMARNNGSTPGTRPATVVGMQNGLQVFAQTVDLTIPVGEKVMARFGPYTPTSPGVIAWSATIADDDPDVDVASGETVVLGGMATGGGEDDNDHDDDHNGTRDDKRDRDRDDD